MDIPSTGETRPDTVRARRQRMRDEARASGFRRSRSGRPQRFETPEWLDRSFVLPLTGPEVSAMAAQHVPHHDGLETFVDQRDASTSSFVRPPSQEVDFARVIKRAEGARLANRAATVATGVAGLAVIGYLVIGSVPVLAAALVTALVAVIALVLGRRLSAAPIPHLDI